MQSKVDKYSHKTVCIICNVVDGMTSGHSNLSHLQCSCKRAGSTVYIKDIYVKERSKAMAKARQKRKWAQDDRVIVDFEGEYYSGTISELVKGKATVLFDDGEVHKISFKNLKLETEESSLSEPAGQGFQQYEIKWDKELINFKFRTDEGLFFGWWRKLQAKGSELAYGIDLMVEYKEQRYNVDSIHYYEQDPRDDLQSLNADIAAAANKWFYQKCQGTFDTIEDLQQRAAKPTILISKLQTLDNIIIKLKEYRDTAIRSGGQRIMMFVGDGPEEDPSMRIQMDLTTQAHSLQGRIPALAEGEVFDRVAEDKSKGTKGRGQPSAKIPADSKNVKDLITKLQTTTDKTDRRKIRATLRRMGHKGGTRSSQKERSESK